MDQFGFQKLVLRGVYLRGSIFGSKKMFWADHFGLPKLVPITDFWGKFSHNIIQLTLLKPGDPSQSVVVLDFFLSGLPKGKTLLSLLLLLFPWGLFKSHRLEEACSPQAMDSADMFSSLVSVPIFIHTGSYTHTHIHTQQKNTINDLTVSKL